MHGDYPRIAACWHSHQADTPHTPAPTAQPADAAEQRLWLRWCGVTRTAFAQLLDRQRLRSRLEQPTPRDTAPWPQASTLIEPQHRKLPPAGSASTRLRYGVAETRFGKLALAFTERDALCHAAFLAPAMTVDSLLVTWGQQPGSRWTEDQRFAEAWFTRWSEDAVASAVLAPAGTDFQLRVWQALLAIPPAQLMSYQQVAASIGQPGATRAVASAVAGNRIAWIIPCHRVIRADGRTGEYRWGAQRKQLMIGWEAARAQR